MFAFHDNGNSKLAEYAEYAGYEVLTAAPAAAVLQRQSSYYKSYRPRKHLTRPSQLSWLACE